MNVLVIDVGGSHVKLARSGIDQSRKFDSSPDLAPTRLIDQVHALTSDCEYGVVSLGNRLYLAVVRSTTFPPNRRSPPRKFIRISPSDPVIYPRHFDWALACVSLIGVQMR